MAHILSLLFQGAMMFRDVVSLLRWSGAGWTLLGFVQRWNAGELEQLHL